MALTLEKPVVEKIESLKNLMIASVTDGDRDEQRYTQIRKELFKVPKLEEALPRFVRTCSSLSQFWPLIKEKHSGPGSYEKRREYISNAFHPLLAGIDDEVGIEREKFFIKGSEHDAYVHIRTILQTAKAGLFLIDSYMDGSIYQLLGTLMSEKMTVRSLTMRCPSDFALETEKFVKQYPNFSAEVRTTKDLHDRFIILDQARCYLIGASIKDAGKKGFAIVPLQEPSIVEFILNYANQVWEAAKPL